MKKRVITALTVVIAVAVLVTAFTACENNALLDSTWELAVVLDAHGEVVACGEGYSYGDEVKKISVTCSVSESGKIDLVYNDEGKRLTGDMEQVSTDADGTLRYHVEYSDGMSGTVVYTESYDKKASDDAKTVKDVAEQYALTVTVSYFTEEYTMYFERVSTIK